VSIAELQELAQNPGDIRRLVDHLTAARLLVSQTAADGSAQGSTAEIVHESLIHSWPALRRWLDETQEDAAFVEQLRVAAKQWHAKGRDAGLLWRGESAEEAIRWARRHQGPLPETQRAFLAAVINESTRAERRRRTVTVGVVTFLTLLLVAAAFALFTIRKSEQKATRNANEATRQTKIARVAQGEAEKALAEAQEKERQRLEEQAKKEAALKEKLRPESQLEMTYDDLQKAYSDLKVALADSEESRERAKRAQGVAERNEEEAVRQKRVAEAAESEARVAKAQVEKLLLAEQERVRRLEEQIGQMIETLK